MAESAGAAERLILVHGATSGPWVFDHWPAAFPGYDVRVPDLQAGLDVAQAGMTDYVDRVLGAAAGRPAVVCGWSMGGLVALMAATRCAMRALVLIEPSLPLELSGGDPRRELRSGTYDAESAYGPLAPGTRSRLESLRALDERKRGISVPSVDCPTLVVTGRTVQPQGRLMASHYDAVLLEFPDLEHPELVADPRVFGGIASWLATAVPRRQPRLGRSPDGGSWPE